jgi:hypothetical protein
MATAEGLGLLSRLSPGEIQDLERFVDRRVEEFVKKDAILRKHAAEPARSELINGTLASVAAKAGMTEGEFLLRLAAEADRIESIHETLASITAKTKMTPEEAMAMALTFYEVAVDAIRQDQRVVLVDKDYRYVREVTGLMRAEPDISKKVAG